MRSAGEGAVALAFADYTTTPPALASAFVVTVVALYGGMERACQKSHRSKLLSTYGKDS